MPTTFQAIAIILFAVVPGGLYTWGYERQTNSWRIAAPDRLIRFVAWSAAFHIAVAPVTYLLWRRFIQGASWTERGHFPWLLWLATLLYLAFPFAVGSVAGLRAAGSRRLRRLFKRPSDPPRAWDYLFARRPDGWIRMRLKSGKWIGAPYARGSYAAGYPEEPDLFFKQLAETDEAGEFVLDENGSPELRDTSLLIRWDEIEYLEFDEG